MVKKIAFFGLYALLAVVCLASAAFAYLYFRQPARQPARNIRVAMTADRVARGEYLFNLGGCDVCHSEHDETKLYRPTLASRRGAGQVFPSGGDIIPKVPNITPDVETGIGAWTDGEKIRAIREGIRRDGSAMFPMMPYEKFRKMSDEDVEALVAFLNTLPPVRQKISRTDLPLPLRLMMKSQPRPVTAPVPTPSRSKPVVYGEYLATIGICSVCHTPFQGGSYDLTKRFAGGRRFSFGKHVVVSANITPDRNTGIGNWTREYFRDRFYRHNEWDTVPVPAVTPERFSIMPWLHLRKLRSDDLDALYEYLMAVPPVENKVDVHPLHVASR